MNVALIPYPPQFDEQRWHMLFKIAPLMMILFYMRTRPELPLTQIGLAEEFGIDRKTAASCLRQLKSYKMVAHMDHNNGYVLADGGLQMLLDFDAGWGGNGHPALKESFKDLKDSLKDKKERKKQMGNFWTSPDGLTTEKILAETAQLFGFETLSYGVSDRDPGLAMTLIAHAYDQRARLAKPQIFVYRRLQRNEPPDKKYQADPLQFLPNAFLHALGLAELEVVVDSDVIDMIEGNQAAIYTVDNTVDDFAIKCWQDALQRVAMDTPRKAITSFWTWVKGTKPIHFENNILRIGARNKYTKDWCDDRLLSAVEQALIGIMDQVVKVEFVVATETEL